MARLTEEERRELMLLNRTINYSKIEELARVKGRVIDIPVHKSSYILLSSNLFNEASSERRWADLWQKDGATGFFYGNTNSNKAYFFVLESNVPEEFRQFVALHEYIEWTFSPPAGVYASPEDNPHASASEFEIRSVFQRGKYFSLKYLSWLPDEFFEQIDPNFFKRKDKSKMSGLELCRETVRLLSAIRYTSAKTWLRSFPWLRKVNKKREK
jgi:hypothetical protein